MSRIFLLCCCLMASLAGLANGATLIASYVKTLGQSNADGPFAFVTAGGRLALDEAGNVYCGTPGGGSYLQKISPTGKILWQTMTNVPGFQGTAVDSKYLYTCGSGYYGQIQLQRWMRDTGTPAPGWQYDWKNAQTALNGVTPPQLPYALAVDEKYLYVADISGNQIRRFDKESGIEVPFAQSVLCVAPCDLALTPTNKLLVLTADSVLEFNKEGKPLRVPVIDELSHPTALDVAKNGEIYIAVAGDIDEQINRVRVYSSQGKLLREIGIGGEFSGRWHPLSFAFSSGAGDIAMAPNGEMWVNAYGHRMGLCPLLTRFNLQEKPRADLTLQGVRGSSLVVDKDLNVTVGGNFKLSWDGKLLWTAGLVPDGAAKLFPTTLQQWYMNPVWTDGMTTIFSIMFQNYFYRVNAENGAQLTSFSPGAAVVPGTCTLGQKIFYTGPDRTIFSTTSALTPPVPFMTLPATAKPATGLLAISADEQLVYLSDQGVTACYKRDGSQLWSAKGNLGALLGPVLFVTNAQGPGIVALDAVSGAPVANIGSSVQSGNPALNGVSAMAIGSKDGTDYLFIEANAAIVVYKIAVG